MQNVYYIVLVWTDADMENIDLIGDKVPEKQPIN